MYKGEKQIALFILSNYLSVYEKNTNYRRAERENFRYGFR